MESPVYTMNRKNLINLLYERYTNLGGEILFDHKLKDIKLKNKELIFTNSKNFTVVIVHGCVL